MKKMILTVGASVILAACGSSGGSNTTTTTSTNTNRPTTSTTTTTTTNTTAQTTTGGKNFFAKTSTGGKMDIAFDGGSDIYQMTVNGVKVNLTGAYGSTINGGKVRTYGYGIGSGSKLQGIDAIHTSSETPNVVYGIMRTSTGNAAFFNGKETAANQIPASGKVDYAGQYVASAGAGNYRQGAVQLNADFGSKKLTGSASDFKFDANISGNKFESAAGAATSVKGGFFGVNAAQIGGVFQNGDTVGAFGAQKK